MMYQQKEMIFISRYKIVYKGGQGEIEVKKSKFIATIAPVNTEEEAIAFIDDMKKKYYNATHNCSAYIIGENNEITRFSDDGEPSRTAGLPMLDVLLGEKLHNVVAVVTRYFGGTLLGTGGLVRAYSDATKEGLMHSTIIEKHKGNKIHLKMDYTSLGKVQYILAENQIPILDTIYTDSVEITYVSPADTTDKIKKELLEATSASIEITPKSEIYYSTDSGKLLLFDS